MLLNALRRINPGRFDYVCVGREIILYQMIAILKRCITMTHDTKKTKKLRLRKLFRSAPPPVREDDTKVSLSLLKKLAKTKEHEDILKLIEHETIPAVRDAWIDYFFEKTRCPKRKSE